MKVLLILVAFFLLAAGGVLLDDEQSAADIMEAIAKKKEAERDSKIKAERRTGQGDEIDNWVDITRPDGTTYSVRESIADAMVEFEEARSRGESGDLVDDYKRHVPADSNEGVQRLKQRHDASKKAFEVSVGESLESAKAFAARLAQISNTDLISDLMAWDKYISIMKKHELAEDVIASDVRLSYISALLVTDNISKETAIELFHLTNKVPLYANFKAGVEIPEVKEIQAFDTKRIISDSETFFFLEKKLEIRRHFYRMKGLLRLALRK